MRAAWLLSIVILGGCKKRAEPPPPPAPLGLRFAWMPGTATVAGESVRTETGLGRETSQIATIGYTIAVEDRGGQLTVGQSGLEVAVRHDPPLAPDEPDLVRIEATLGHVRPTVLVGPDGAFAGAEGFSAVRQAADAAVLASFAGEVDPGPIREKLAAELGDEAIESSARADWSSTVGALAGRELAYAMPVRIGLDGGRRARITWMSEAECPVGTCAVIEVAISGDPELVQQVAASAISTLGGMFPMGATPRVASVDVAVVHTWTVDPATLRPYRTQTETRAGVALATVDQTVSIARTTRVDLAWTWATR